MANNMTEENIRATGAVLNNKERPLKERFRALFTLKNIGGPIALEYIQQCFNDDSALLKHELAYCLGQMQEKDAIPILVSVLEDTKHEAMVRHEAAEALGAIGLQEPVPILEKYAKDPIPEIAETCEIALARLKWIQENGPITNANNPYSTVDPAPPANTDDVEKLKTTLLDENAKLFDRYRAMFSLRNLVTSSAVQALGAGLRSGKSALFRHEVAFVLGQIQHSDGVMFLKETLEDVSENEMVRHECAEALGAIATNECFTILDAYVKDDKRVVKESCEIALDMCDYENSPEFQYANTLSQIDG